MSYNISPIETLSNKERLILHLNIGGEIFSKADASQALDELNHIADDCAQSGQVIYIISGPWDIKLELGYGEVMGNLKFYRRKELIGVYPYGVGVTKMPAFFSSVIGQVAGLHVQLGDTYDSTLELVSSVIEKGVAEQTRKHIS